MSYARETIINRSFNVTTPILSYRLNRCISTATFQCTMNGKIVIMEGYDFGWWLCACVSMLLIIKRSFQVYRLKTVLPAHVFIKRKMWTGKFGIFMMGKQILSQRWRFRFEKCKYRRWKPFNVNKLGIS